MPPSVRVAVVQAAPVPFDSAATVPIVDSLIGEAATAGARLVLSLRVDTTARAPVTFA